jgi:hypothetical protein
MYVCMYVQTFSFHVQYITTSASTAETTEVQLILPVLFLSCMSTVPFDFSCHVSQHRSPPVPQSLVMVAHLADRARDSWLDHNNAAHTDQYNSTNIFIVVAVGEQI